MKIQVLGAGCSSCKKLYELTKQAAEELNLQTEVEYITDIQKIVALGIMTSPVLVVNDRPVISGFVPDINRIKEALGDNHDETTVIKKGAGGCSCGGNC